MQGEQDLLVNLRYLEHLGLIIAIKGYLAAILR